MGTSSSSLGVSPFPQLVHICSRPGGYQARDVTDDPTPITGVFAQAGIVKTSWDEEAGVRSEKGTLVGCSARRLHVNVHCAQTHLECFAHILPEEMTERILENASWVFSQAVDYKLAIPEIAVMITVPLLTLEESGESYPVGLASDFVISKKEIENALELIGRSELENEKDLEKFDHGNGVSVILRVMGGGISREEDGNIRDWPYPTSEALAYLQSLGFRHLRTNLPSIEKMDSKGGMWNHAFWFGLDPERKKIDVEAYRGSPGQKRTIGEFLFLPSIPVAPDGVYTLQCNLIEYETADFAQCVPYLYKF